MHAEFKFRSSRQRRQPEAQMIQKTSCSSMSRYVESPTMVSKMRALARMQTRNPNPHFTVAPAIPKSSDYDTCMQFRFGFCRCSDARAARMTH